MTVNLSRILSPVPALDDRALRMALESAKNYATFLLDPAGYVKTWNIGAQKIKGYAAEEIIGRHFSCFYTADDRSAERPRRALETARTAGFYQEEGTRVRKDGHTFDAAVTITALYDTSSELMGFVKVTWDIGELRNRERALSDSQNRLAGIVQSAEEQLRLAVDATQLGTWELDPQTGGRHWSERSRALFGISPSAELTTEVIMAQVHPEDRQRLFDVMRDVLSNEAHRDLDVQFRLVGGEYREERWIESRGRTFYSEGRAVRFIGTMLDITARKRAEAELRASEDRYRTLFEWAPDGILIADRQSYYIGANESICRMLGYRRDELVGLHASDIVVPEEITNIAPALSAISARAEYHREWKFRRKDGSVFSAEVIATMMPDGNLLGMVRDITERKQAEEALRESERRFRTMVNSIPQLAWTAHADGYIYWYNQQWYEYTGTTHEEIEGWAWQSVHHPAVLPAVMKAWRAAIHTGKTFEMEFPIRGADGKFRAFLTRVQPLTDSDGRVVQWFGTNTDVEVLKQAEQKINQLNAELEQRVVERTAQLESAVRELSHSRAELESLFESLPGLYLVLTTDLRIVSVSDAYLKAALMSRDEILGRNVFEIIQDNPDDSEANAVANLQASIDRVIQNSAPDTMGIQRYDVRRPSGAFEERYWSPVNSPIFGGDRKIKYIVHRVEDVTDFVRQKAQHPERSAALSARMQQMEAEVFQSSQKLQTANAQLEAANKELESFSYSVSHDLRAPLRGVHGFVSMLQEKYSGKLDEEGNRWLGIVAGESKRMGRLIDDLLAFSRLGRESMKQTSVDMNGLAASVFENLMIGTAQELAPRFVLQPLPAAHCDRSMLRQVFVNLIGNAIKFSRNKPSPVIEVGCNGGTETVYYVKDNGAGFDERYCGKLFGVFQRLHSEQEFEGTGVGLALVQRIIQRHNGRIWATGKLGEGATFYFTLASAKEGNS